MADQATVMRNDDCNNRRKLSPKDWIGLIAGVIGMVAFAITMIGILTSAESRITKIEGADEKQEIKIGVLFEAVKEIKEGQKEMASDIKQLLRRRVAE